MGTQRQSTSDLPSQGVVTNSCDVPPTYATAEAQPGIRRVNSDPGPASAGWGRPYPTMNQSFLGSHNLTQESQMFEQPADQQFPQPGWLIYGQPRSQSVNFPGPDLSLQQDFIMIAPQQAQHDRVYPYPAQQFVLDEFGPARPIAHGPTGAISAAKEQITTGHFQRSDKIILYPSTLGLPNHDFNMTTLASSQPQPSPFYPSTIHDGPSVAGFRPAGEGAPQLKRGFSSVDSAMDEQSPVSAASPEDAPPGKMRIPALKRPRNDSTVNNGPLSKEVVLISRPKPGRKPMADQNDSTDKRKNQNRQAQRNFRDRRAQKCQELEIENAQLKAEKAEAEARESTLIADNARLAATVGDAVAGKAQAVLELQQERERNMELQRQIGNCCNAYYPVKAIMLTLAQRSVIVPNFVSSVHQILTPPSDNDPHDEYEVDFTNIYATRKPSAFASGLGTDEHCGFCSDVENCICRQQEELNNKSLPSLPPIDSSRATAQPKLPSDISTPSFLEARTEASGPGTCDMCLADPEKARQCRELAEVAFQQKEAASTRSEDSGSKDMGTVTLRRLKQLDSVKHNERTSCSDFFQQAQQKNVRLRRDDYQQIKHVYRLDSRSEHSPYMEMDTQDAAHALAALSRQDTRSGMERQS
ncbi:unnamed protein product [Aureobasidium uvarum]|uniref:BZIP domain-containing protein n=1 Tax=Aureobasidium uvarum TaxID=2773716 RepID=A0A9N8PTK4_9PEZI|nr:unnamed protein product [Aureobasidium uvarum]